MSIRPGMRLAHYEILGPLGVGGMGEVWRARDTELKREVALKILPAEFAGSPDRLARFEREAVVLASLNHPNIASIYELGHADDLRFLVLELVEGPTLDQRLLAGPIPVREVLAIAIQIADALEAAHDKGILHRDLKPANVKVTPEGKVKVLDFGLAKAFGDAALVPSALDEATFARDNTEAGMVMGTASYMSPEQAEGKSVDKRTDIWSFGVLLFEMLTRRRLFDGKSTSHVLVHVMEQEPDWSALPPLPEGVLTLLQRCLQKDRNQRLRDIGDVRIQLQGSQTHPIRARGTAAEASESHQRRLWPAVVAAAGIAAAIAIAVIVYPRPAPPVEVAPLRFEIARPESVASSSWVVISPDGRQLAYAASVTGELARLWIRSLETQEARPLAGTAGFEGRPFWSPDSRSLTFSEGGKVRKIDAAGGPAQVLADAGAVVVGGYWPTADRVRYGVLARGLFEIPSSGGNPVAVSTGPSSNPERAIAPSPMPGGNFVFCQCSGDNGGIFIATADGEPPRRILPDLTLAQYAPSPDPNVGYILFSRGAASPNGFGGTLMAQGIHPRRLSLIGDPIAIAEAVNGFSASDTGVLVYSTNNRGVPVGVPGILEGQLTWFDRQGRILSTVGDPGILRIPRLSPDGQHVALERADPQTQNMDIYLFEFARGVNNRFTFSAAREFSPVWSPDGRSLIYTRGGAGTSEWYRKSADLAGDDELLLRLPVLGVPSTLTPDGRFALYTELVPPYTLKAVELARVAEARESLPVVVTGFSAINAVLSPDGKWFAYVSNESGNDELYVRAFVADAAPGAPLSTGGKVMVSNGGANRGGAVWRRDGRELFYLAPDGTLMSVSVNTEPTFSPAGPPKALFKIPPEVAYFDISPDGERFLISVPTGRGVTAPPYNVVLNWTATLK